MLSITVSDDAERRDCRRRDICARLDVVFKSAALRSHRIDHLASLPWKLVNDAAKVVTREHHERGEDDGPERVVLNLLAKQRVLPVRSTDAVERDKTSGVGSVHREGSLIDDKHAVE